MQPLPRVEDPSESMILQTSSGIEPFAFLHISIQRKKGKSSWMRNSWRQTNDKSSKEKSLKIERNVTISVIENLIRKRDQTELNINPAYLLIYGMQHKPDCCAKNSQLATAYLSVKIKQEIIQMLKESISVLK